MPLVPDTFVVPSGTTTVRVGLPAPGGPLPSWVPAAGEVAVLTVANGKLANNFREVVAPYYGAFWSIGIVNAYSGGFPNQWWGSYGAMILWGAGHSSSNDNAMMVAELRANDVIFRRIIDPTPYAGTGTDSTTKGSNSRDNWNVYVNFDYGETTIDGKVCANHSYASGDVLGPADGGAACGTFVNVMIAAINHANDRGSVGNHDLAMANTTGPFAWERRSNTFVDVTIPNAYMAPLWTAHVSPQGRIYYVTNNSQGVRWFDLATHTYVTGTGAGPTLNVIGADTGILFYVPSRSLLIFMCCSSGHELRVIYMDVSVAQPSWSATAATLSATTYVPVTWSAACWCADNGRIIVGAVTATAGGGDYDSSAVYEIEIPATLTDAWTITRAPFGAGQTITWPAAFAPSAGVTYKKWSYLPTAKVIPFFPYAQDTPTADTMWAYRPRGT